METTMETTMGTARTFDATTWAKSFNETLVKLGYQPHDEGWLTGWFANAIMCGYDHAAPATDPAPAPAVVAPVAWIVSASESIPYPHIERLVDVGGYPSGTKLYAAAPPATDALDAQRYRWLRVNAATIMTNSEYDAFVEWLPEEKELDAAIDAAMRYPAPATREALSQSGPAAGDTPERHRGNS
jgi:hypothetical protein